MLRLADSRQAVLITGFTDLRAGIDRLVSLVKTKYAQDPYAQTVYLFCGRRSDRCKCVYWDNDRGFVLVYCRLEKGHLQWPRGGAQEALMLTKEQFRRLFEGYAIEEKSTIETVKRRDIY